MEPPTATSVPAAEPSPVAERAPIFALNKMDLALRAAVHGDSDAPLRVIMQLSSRRQANTESLERLKEAGIEVLGVGGFDPAVVARVRPAALVGLAD